MRVLVHLELLVDLNRVKIRLVFSLKIDYFWLGEPRKSLFSFLSVDSTLFIIAFIISAAKVRVRQRLRTSLVVA